MGKGLRTACIGLWIGMAGAFVACSGLGDDPGGLLGPDSAGLESDGLAPTSSGSGSGSGVRIEARMEPIIAVDASGHARSEDNAGTADDRFDAQVEIDKDNLRRLGIDAADGFLDEVVRLRITRNGSQVFATTLRFSENRVQDITFEVDIRRGPAPELRAGDVARVSVNGTQALRGTFRRN